MIPLPERISDLMKAMSWTKSTQVADAAGVSRSAVAQWLGKAGVAQTGTVNVTAAMNLQRKTGFAADWIATGRGPRLAEAGASAKDESGVSIEEAVERLGIAIAAAPPESREALAQNMAGWARDGGKGPWPKVVVSLLAPTSDGHVAKRRAA